MKKYPYKRTLLFYFFTIIFLGSLLINSLQVLVLKYNPQIEKTNLDVLTNSLLQFLVYLVLVIGIAILMRGFFKQEFLEFKKQPGKLLLAGFLGLLFMYFLIYCLTQFLSLINYQPETPDNQLAIERTFFSYPLLMLPVLTLAAPFVEETIFRGIIFKTIYDSKSKITTVTAFILSSCLFGFIHVFSSFLMTGDYKVIIDGISYFLSGFSLTFIYYKTKNIYAPMITHFLYNSVATFLLFIVYFFKEFLPTDLTTSAVYALLKLLHLQ